MLTTYDFLASHHAYAKDAHFDIIVYEEASLLSAVCSEGSRQAKILKEISENAFKILLTGTPIEKNIMDLYGLIYFIDEDVLPDKETYMHRYLRKPENYPELAARGQQILLPHPAFAGKPVCQNPQTHSYHAGIQALGAGAEIVRFALRIYQ